MNLRSEDFQGRGLSRARCDAALGCNIPKVVGVMHEATVSAVTGMVEQACHSERI
jgi:hypothetical protein